MINDGVINGSLINGDSTPWSLDIGTVSVPITQTIFSLNDTVSVGITQVIFSKGVLSAVIESIIVNRTSTLNVGITQQVMPPATSLSVGITQSIVTPPAAPSGGQQWSVKVYLGGVDVSINLTGTVSVDCEVNAARVASFTLKPTAGIVNPFDWVKKPVRIDYIHSNSAGTVLGTYQLFSGVVDTPIYNPTTRLTSFDCTDQLQKKFEAMPKDAIAALIPGFWSDAVFSKDADPWTYAQDLLSTIPYDMDANLSGNIILTPWLAKSTADFAFNSDTIIDESLLVTLANSRDLINDYAVSLDYRYEQYRERGVRIRWDMDPPVLSADSITYNPQVPAGQTFNDAVSAAGLAFTVKPWLEPLPVSGTYTVFGFVGGAQSVLFANENPDGIQSATGVCSLRYSQTITEKRKTRVYAPQSVGQLGSIKADMSASVQADYGDKLKDFNTTEEREESHTNTARAVTVSSGGSNVVYNIGGLVTTKYQAHKIDYSAYAGASYGTPNEIIYNFTSLVKTGSRADSNNADETLLNLASTGILGSHRKNSAAFTTILAPYLDRKNTVRIDTDTVTAKGKVRQITHTMDIERGSAVSEVTLAISLASAVGIPPSPPVLAAPTADALKPSTNSVYAQTMVLPTHVAGLSGAFSDTWDGWIATSAVEAEGYNNSFVIKFGGVPDANVQEQEVPHSAEFQVIIPIDELILEA